MRLLHAWPDHGRDRHAVLGGSPSCIAVYPGDFAVALAAFDSRIDVLSARGGRSIPILDFYRLPGSTPDVETALAADELIARIVVPATQAARLDLS